jgi:hypothetical protein
MITSSESEETKQELRRFNGVTNSSEPCRPTSEVWVRSQIDTKPKFGRKVARKSRTQEQVPKSTQACDTSDANKHVDARISAAHGKLLCVSPPVV